MDAFPRSVTEAAKRLAAKELSSVELVQECLDAIERDNARLNALLSVAPDALEQAKAIDARRAKGEDLGPLAGIPVAVKDNILVQGWNASAGSRVLEGYKAPHDATAVARLKAAGAVLIGRANMDEFAMGSSGESSHYGPTKNPWDDSRVPGGSSSGSCAAVASGMALAALGSDTGGSIRQPASLCGLTGLKPTYGRVSRNGLIALSSSLDVIGPIARTAQDAALVLRAIEGGDPLDATTPESFDASSPELGVGDLTGVRVGLPKEYFLDGMDARVTKSVMDAVAVLESLGAEILEVSLPHTKHALAAYYLIMPAEASSNLGRYDGMRYGFSSTGASLAESYARTRGEGFGTEVKRRVMLGSFVLSAGYVDAYYRQASKVRTLIRRDFDEAFRQVDLIASPTSPSVAWKLGERFADPLMMYLSDIYTISANLASVPGISLPCGLLDGLPVGLQLMAKPFDDDALLRTGAAYQEKTDWHLRTPA